uniref:Uncharacterized protein n=1 Tax=Caenorhabditis japonica TaxID=281687 RepID=A0A8R1IQF9_CAEJA
MQCLAYLSKQTPRLKPIYRPPSTRISSVQCPYIQRPHIVSLAPPHRPLNAHTPPVQHPHTARFSIPH